MKMITFINNVICTIIMSAMKLPLSFIWRATSRREILSRSKVIYWIIPLEAPQEIHNLWISCPLLYCATDHITANLLHKTSLSKHFFINLPNRGVSQILFVGSIRIWLKIILEEVLHVPSFHINLLSVRKITQALNYSITFFSQILHFLVYDTKEDDWLREIA